MIDSPKVRAIRFLIALALIVYLPSVLLIDKNTFNSISVFFAVNKYRCGVLHYISCPVEKAVFESDAVKLLTDGCLSKKEKASAM
jgi:hypothetical protein